MAKNKKILQSFVAPILFGKKNHKIFVSVVSISFFVVDFDSFSVCFVFGSLFRI